MKENLRLAQEENRSLSYERYILSQIYPLMKIDSSPSHYRQLLKDYIDVYDDVDLNDSIRALLKAYDGRPIDTSSFEIFLDQMETPEGRKHRIERDNFIRKKEHEEHLNAMYNILLGSCYYSYLMGSSRRNDDDEKGIIRELWDTVKYPFEGTLW